MAQPVLLLDDGELDDVQAILEDLGISYARVRGGAIVAGQPAPSTLLVSTPRRVSAVKTAGAKNNGSGPVRVVVADEDSNTMRRQLRESGFDYLVRRPVHAEALRLLLMHCVYTGEERREDPRYPVGCEVQVKAGFRTRSATLAELSSRGCRLLSATALEPGKRLRISIPQADGRGDPLTLRGRVLRMSFDERLGDEGLYTSAVVFEEVGPSQRSELEWTLEEHARGPAVLAHDEKTPDARPDANAESGAQADAGPGAAPAAPRKTPTPDSPNSGAEVDATGGYSKHAPPRARTPRTAGPPAADGGTGPPSGPDAAAEAAPPRAEKRRDPRDRRTSERRSFASKVPAFGERALRVLVGRDLSAGGMRVERFPGLELGDRMHLAIYGEPGSEPILVWASVNRDDGERGVALVFDELHPLIGERLEKLVAALPAVESLHDDEAAAMGTVMSEILSR